MAQLVIDGKAVRFTGRKMILQVALENGLLIPHYCYHPGLSIVGSCRLCLAEIAQPNPRTHTLELVPKLVPTCATPAADGMVVHTQSPKAIANQKAVMEYFLTSHPLDCPVCDKAGECSLQDFSFGYGRAVSRFEEDKVKNAVKEIGPRVKLYADRCIFCNRCVRFCREITGTAELGWYGRGAWQEIDIFPGKPLANELSVNVVDLCPVGALTEKDFLFQQRVWFLTNTPSIDGVTASGDNIWIDQNEGQIYRIRPRFNPEVNRWWTSDEIRAGWKPVHSPDRLRHPRRQQYGTQIACTWSQACTEAAQNLHRLTKEKGPGVLALLISPMLSCEEAYLLGRLARDLDPRALLGIGPVPVEGQNKTFPGGYTVYAEKCPNLRGVQRALDLVNARPAPAESAPATGVLDFAGFLRVLADKAGPVASVIVTGNYPSPWITRELMTGLARKFTVLIDTLANDLSPRADIVLPTGTWAETAGTFENIHHRLQSYCQAIDVLEDARTVGQIALDLAAAAEGCAPGIFDADAVRQEMGGVFITDVAPARLPAPTRESAMTYVPL